MVLLRALSRGSRVLGARSLLLSAPKKLQTPSTLSSQFHSFVYNSPNKIHNSSLYFNGFQRFGTSPESDPLGIKNAKQNGCTNLGEAKVGNDQAKQSGSVSDADILKADMERLVEQIAEFINAEKGFLAELKRDVPPLAEILEAMNNSENSERRDEILREMDKIETEVEELIKAKYKLAEEMHNKVYGTLKNVMARTGIEVDNFKKLGKKSPVKGSLIHENDESEDKASLHEELELARKNLSQIILKSEELGLRCRFKFDELGKKFKTLQELKKTADDREMLVFFNREILLYGSNAVALWIWLFIKGN